MDRRTLLRLPLISLCGSLLGCRGQRIRYDDPPDRGLFEDRWQGHHFTNMEARYALKLTRPDPSLSRSEEAGVAVLADDGKVSFTLPETPTMQPTTALVTLTFVADAAAESLISVTLRWPLRPDFKVGSKRYVEETFTAPLTFDDTRRFLNGSGRFRCDRNECFYGKKPREAPVPNRESELLVKFSISGPSPDSKHESTFHYEEEAVPWKLAQQACPGIRLSFFSPVRNNG